MLLNDVLFLDGLGRAVSVAGSEAGGSFK